jgi:hypothetical protein
MPAGGFLAAPRLADPAVLPLGPTVPSLVRVGVIAARPSSSPYPAKPSRSAGLRRPSMLKLLNGDAAVQVSLKFAPLLPPPGSARQRRPPEGLLVGHGGLKAAYSGGAAAVPAPALQAGGAPSGRAAQPALLFSGSPSCRRCRTPPWPGRTGSCRAWSWRWGACGRTPASAAAPRRPAQRRAGSGAGVLETRCSLAVGR